ncbi:MAG: NAD(+) synthase [Candidatus Nealsonbacteria bacterium]
MGVIKNDLVDDSRLILEQKLITRLFKTQDVTKVSKRIVEFIKEKVKELDREGIIIGFSGGIDSALTLKLCVLAVGNDKVLALYIPEKDSNPLHKKHAEKYAEELGVRFKVIDITPTLETLGIYKLIPTKILGSRKLAGKLFRTYFKLSENKFKESLGGSSNKFVRKGNASSKTKHRIRMVILYLFGSIKNLLVVGAANKTEGQIGFFAKWGVDHAADIMPIGCLYKTQVIELARYLKVPKEIINKSPSPDLVPGITDEYVIGMPYEILDLILFGIEKGLSVEKISSYLDVSPEKIERVLDWRKRSKHMRESPYLPDFEF